jgi:hypothetical protein
MSSGDRPRDDELPPDEVTRVLRECEQALRHLHAEKRLSADGLRTFMRLSAQVRDEMERRRDGDRRTVPRGTPERRAR